MSVLIVSYFSQTLECDCPTYFDSETGLLEAPMIIRVADQVCL